MREEFLIFLGIVNAEMEINSNLCEKIINLYDKLTDEEKETFLNFGKCCYDSGWSAAYG